MSSATSRSTQAATANLPDRSEEHTSELQSPCNLVCRLLLEKKKNKHHARSIGPVSAPTKRAQNLRIAARNLKEFCGASNECPRYTEALDRHQLFSPRRQTNGLTTPNASCIGQVWYKTKRAYRLSISDRSLK